MKINPKARIDRGRVRVRRGGGRSGGFPMPGGGGSGGGSGLPIPTGGGIVGIVLVVILLIVLAQCNGGLPGMGGSSSDTSGDEIADCETGADAAKSENCKLNLFVSAIERFWDEELPKEAGVDYTDAQMQIFSGSTSSGCGQASSAMGPFYCPVDQTIYFDPSFFRDILQQQLNGPSGAFVEPYVIAHEFGHHIQNLLGTMSKVKTQQGRNSDSVRLELQADCYAGMWTRNATRTEDSQGNVLIQDLSAQDVQDAIAAAKAVGDDTIQQETTGRVSPEQWTHGSSLARMRWFGIGYDNGTLDACNTFTNADVD